MTKAILVEKVNNFEITEKKWESSRKMLKELIILFQDLYT